MGCSASTVTSGGRGGCFRGRSCCSAGPHAYDAPDRIGAVCRPGAPGGTCHRQSLTSGKIDNAKAELARALNTLVVTSVAFPLTVLRAEAAIAKAEKLAETDKRDAKQNEELSTLLSSVCTEIEMAQILGYGKKADFKPIFDQVKFIEQKSAGGKSGKGWFDELKTRIQKLF